MSRPGPAWAGIGLMLTGVPAYFLWQHFGKKSLVEEVLSEAELP